MKASLDRIEGDRAVLVVEGREHVVPRASLPADAREGDLIDLDTLQRDAEGTERLADEVRDARAKLKRSRNPGAL